MNIKPKDKQPNKKRTPKRPKKITESYLHNSGLYYLQRFVSSSANFKSVMTRKVKKSCAHHKDQDYDACIKMVDELTEKFEELGLLNDSAYTKGVINSMRRQGKSKKAILAKLASKGLRGSEVEQELMTHDAENDTLTHGAERDAALIFARKKRLGPFRTKPVEDQQKTLQKELGAFARAGFSYDTSRFILDLEKEEIQNFSAL